MLGLHRRVVLYAPSKRLVEARLCPGFLHSFRFAIDLYKRRTQGLFELLPVAEQVEVANLS